MLTLRAFVRFLIAFLTGAGAALAQPAPGRGEIIEGTSLPVARFYPTTWQPADGVASFALQRAFGKARELPGDFAVKPAFEKLDGNRQRVRIEMPAGTSYYGTGEVSGPLLRNGRTVTLWNSDAYGYDINTASLYQSHPWVFAVRPDGSTVGVLADTTWRTTIALDGAIVITGEGGAFPVYVVDRGTPQEVCTALMELTGPMPLPPRWALGYHQCRYSYYPEARVREIAKGFRDREIPCDVIWFDIDYMDEFKVFTFNKEYFPDVKGLNDELHGQGFHTIYMIDPGIKQQKGYAVSDAMLKAGYEVKNAKGDPFVGAVWPGNCNFPDYTSEQVRAWWAALYAPFMANGIDGVWNDMNEPAVFAVESKTMPEDNQHRGGTYSAGAGKDAVSVSAGPHARFHNVYGMLMAQGTFEGIQGASPEKRPFVLTRAGHLGSQRYAATWTGDNTANWFDLEHSVPMALNLGLSGQPFAGPDIGGFNGNGPGNLDARGQLFARWMGIGALLPFSRGHTGKGNINKEPWSFGPAVEQTCKLALQRRARLVPYLYTLFREASVAGLPVVRPAFFADPKDAALRAEDDCFLLGGDVLVVPQMMPDGSRVPVLPRGVWRGFDLVGEKGDANLPLLKLREGAILPVGPVMNFTGEKPMDPITLIVSLDTAGTATGTLYEDAGDGYGYAKNEFRLTTFAAKSEGGKVTVSVAKRGGGMEAGNRKLIVQVLRDGGVVLEGTGNEADGVVIELK
ncbi:glycoside hydrolase family 31 protein [soil metagenome]